MGSPHGFFFKRNQVDFGIRNAGSANNRIVEYQSTTQTIATVVSSRLATLHELDTVYGVEDLWILLEVNAVDKHNAYIVSQR